MYIMICVRISYVCFKWFSSLILQEEPSNLTTAFVVQFTPTLVNTRTPDPAWNGNMSLTPLNSVPVLSVVGGTSAMVCITISINNFEYTLVFKPAT